MNTTTTSTHEHPAGDGNRLTTLADGLSMFGQGTIGKGVLLIHGVSGSPVEM